MFSARINPLEDNVRLDRGPRHPVVLIAQTATNDGLFAIERVQEGIYAICRLAIWVTLDTFDRLQITPTNIARRQKRQFQEHPRLWENSWWSTAAIDLKPASEFNLSEYSNFEKTRAVRLCLQKPEQISTTIPAQVTQEPPPVDIQGQIGNSLDDTLQEAAKDPEKVLNMVRTQYQDALYASKVRLSIINISLTTDSSLSRLWHTLRKGPCLELELFSMSMMAQPTTTRISRLS